MSPETTPIATLSSSAEARTSLPGGRETAAHHGDPAAEERALLEGCGLFDRSFVDLLDLAGEDRLRFVNGKVTCELAGVEPGRAVYGFVTNRQGRVLADVTVLVLEDRLRLELAPGTGAEIREGMEKFLLADRVEISVPERVAVVSLLGPRAAEVARQAGLAVPAEEGAVEELPVGAGLALRHHLDGARAVTLHLDAGPAGETVDALLAAGAVPVGWEAVETVRLERGTPRFGADFGPDHFPQESGREAEAVSYTKGCYLGQEVVARIHYRGQVNRVPRRLVFVGGLPAAGASLRLDGKEVGRVGSVVDSRRAGAIGLGIVHRKAAEPGTRLGVGEGGETIEAEVRELDG